MAGTREDAPMKLATLNDGSRDGKLVVVSRDLARYAAAANIAQTMHCLLYTSPSPRDS